MDPLAIAAVVGLVFAGKRLSDSSDDDSTTTQPQKKVPIITRRDTDLMAHPGDHWQDYQDVKIMTPDLGRRIGDFRLTPKNEIPSLQFPDKNATRFPYGQPVYNLYDRQNITNKMNNFPPVERQNVGPGLGVGPDVAAAGGFQQFFRVLPNNINEERLTTLPGLEGPPNPVVKNGGAGGMGDVTHLAKASKAWRRDPAQNSGQGQGGALRGFEGRPDQIKTRRTTIRQETGFRGDTLEYGPGQYNVYQPYNGALHDKKLPHLSDNRSNPDRAGNGQRMNVRDDPVNVVGAMTNNRSESTPFPVQAGGAGGGSGIYSTYTRPSYDKFNEFKGNRNPYADTLDIAIKQLEKNSFVQQPLSAN
jgi:hypothetical protein